MNAKFVFHQSDPATTKRYYAMLCARGAIGIVAMNLFRAQKTSTRAKKYHGGIDGVGSYRDLAYERKQFSIDQLCEVLELHGAALKISYGWKEDPSVLFDRKPAWVLYVDLPNGQVSFHSPKRGKGPDYRREWDKQRMSCDRILAFCDSVMSTGSKLF